MKSKLSKYPKTVQNYIIERNRKGGKSKSPKKVAAARLNGLKGGAPKKVKFPSTWGEIKLLDPKSLL